MCVIRVTVEVVRRINSRSTQYNWSDIQAVLTTNFQGYEATEKTAKIINLFRWYCSHLAGCKATRVHKGFVSKSKQSTKNDATVDVGGFCCSVVPCHGAIPCVL